MSCKDCEEVQQRYAGKGGYYYRWKDANICILACEYHAKQVMDYLNKRFDND